MILRGRGWSAVADAPSAPARARSGRGGAASRRSCTRQAVGAGPRSSTRSVPPEESIPAALHLAAPLCLESFHRLLAFRLVEQSPFLVGRSTAAPIERASGPQVVSVQEGAVAYAVQKVALAWFESDEPPEDVEHVHELRGVLRSQPSGWIFSRADG